MTAMRKGTIVRIEEVTRCLPEVQDALVSILSERRMSIPELAGASDDATIYAAPGFNVIATANLRDRGVSEMSAALKRRFNFELVEPVPDLGGERALGRRPAGGSPAPGGARPPGGEGLGGGPGTSLPDPPPGRSGEGRAGGR